MKHNISEVKQRPYKIRYLTDAVFVPGKQPAVNLLE